MDLNFQQETNISQKLVLSAQMKQSLHILQLNMIELIENISRELYENPLLEIHPDSHSDFIYEHIHTPADYSGIHGSNERLSLNQRDNPLYSVINQKTLKDFLKEQAGYLKETEKVMRIIYYIIENIDEKGYLSLSSEELSKELSITLTDCEYAIQKVQEFAPDGVAARDISECLRIQLKKQGMQDSLLFEMVNTCLPLLADNKIKDISTILNITKAKTIEYVKIIKSLEPKPSRGFFSEVASYVLPEATVFVLDGELSLQVHDAYIPQLRLTNGYKEMIKNADEDTQAYIKEKLNSAMFLMKGIHSRNDTMKRILNEIVLLQKDYFLNGEQNLRQMSIQELADRIGVHESTVSRAVKGKYIQTPAKVLKMRDLFTYGYHKEGQNISSQIIKKQILQFIQNENKQNPYSDQDIKELLSRSGFDISRRTIAKYRDALGILSSSKRKTY